MDIKILRATEEWQRAGVHYVRTEAMVKDFNLTLEGEFAADTPEDIYVLALDANLPVSTARIKMIDAETGKIERVATIPSHRSKGIGALVIKECEKWLSELGAKKIIINSRTQALNFYERLGYKADFSKVTCGSDKRFECVETEKTL